MNISGQKLSDSNSDVLNQTAPLLREATSDADIPKNSCGVEP